MVRDVGGVLYWDRRFVNCGVRVVSAGHWCFVKRVCVLCVVGDARCMGCGVRGLVVFDQGDSVC